MAEPGFEIDELLLDGGASITCGSFDPALMLLDRKPGSLFLHTSTGDMFRKIGAMPNAWQMLQTDAGMLSTQTNSQVIPANSPYTPTQATLTLRAGISYQVYGFIIYKSSAANRGQAFDIACSISPARYFLNIQQPTSKTAFFYCQSTDPLSAPASATNAAANINAMASFDGIITAPAQDMAITINANPSGNNTLILDYIFLRAKPLI